MEPLFDPASAEQLAAARRLLGEARAGGSMVRARVAAMTEATAWQARAMDRFRAGMSALEADLARMLRTIDAAEGDLERAAAGFGDASGLLARARG